MLFHRVLVFTGSFIQRNSAKNSEGNWYDVEVRLGSATGVAAKVPVSHVRDGIGWQSGKIDKSVEKQLAKSISNCVSQWRQFPIEGTSERLFDGQ